MTTMAFQSTLPAREATSGSGQIMCPGRISIHASCKGSDHSAGWCRYPGQYFNPRFPRGKRRRECMCMPGLNFISIHASRGGSDSTQRKACYADADFNPRFPRGKRQPFIRHTCWLTCDFNPRFPRGKRQPRGVGVPEGVISIHASRGGSDAFKSMVLTIFMIFQSTLPAGEATVHHRQQVIRS